MVMNINMLIAFYVIVIHYILFLQNVTIIESIILWENENVRIILQNEENDTKLKSNILKM